MNNYDFIIRFANDRDTEAMAEISALSKKRAYDGIVSDAVLNRPIEDKEYRGEQMKLRMKKRISIVAIDKATCKTLGFAQFVLGNEETDEEYADAELCSLYVHPEYQSKGVGAALLKRVKDLCSIGNNKTLALFCFKDNPKAVGFYTKHGGMIFKEQKHQFGDREYEHIIFTFQLNEQGTD